MTLSWCKTKALPWVFRWCYPSKSCLNEHRMTAVQSLALICIHYDHEILICILYAATLCPKPWKQYIISTKTPDSEKRWTAAAADREAPGFSQRPPLSSPPPSRSMVRKMLTMKFMVQAIRPMSMKAANALA